MKLDELSWALAVDVAARLGAATLLGAVLALHPMKIRRLRRGDLDADLVRAGILTCVAAALIIVVVEDSMARAFGLVGIGSFIRFRTALKNPRDTATLFLLIGIGMAAGLKYYAMAACATAFLFALFFVLEAGGSSKPSKEPPEPPLPDDGPF